MKALKTVLSLLMVLCMILSFGTVAFADGEPAAEGAPTPTAAAPAAEAPVKVEILTPMEAQN